MEAALILWNHAKIYTLDRRWLNIWTDLMINVSLMQYLTMCLIDSLGAVTIFIVHTQIRKLAWIRSFLLFGAKPILDMLFLYRSDRYHLQKFQTYCNKNENPIPTGLFPDPFVMSRKLTLGMFHWLVIKSFPFFTPQSIFVKSSSPGLLRIEL